MSLDVVVFGTSGRFTDESYLKKFGLLWKVQFPKKYNLKDSTGSPMSKEKALQFRNEQLRIFESRLDETSQYYDPMYIPWDKRVRRWTFDDGTVYRSFARLDDAIAARKRHIPSFMQNPLHLIKKVDRNRPNVENGRRGVTEQARGDDGPPSTKEYQPDPYGDALLDLEDDYEDLEPSDALPLPEVNLPSWSEVDAQMRDLYKATGTCKYDKRIEKAIHARNLDDIHKDMYVSMRFWLIQTGRKKRENQKLSKKDEEKYALLEKNLGSDGSQPITEELRHFVIDTFQRKKDKLCPAVVGALISKMRL